MKKPLSGKALAIAPSSTLAIDAMFKKMKAEGKDVVGFGAGEPDFNTPGYIKEAAVTAIANNQTRYTPAAGTESLRSAVSAQVKRDYGLDYPVNQIVVSSGAKHSIFIAVMALCDPGDEVILPAPYWVSYPEMVRMAGAVPVIVNAEKEQRFLITPDQLRAAITPKTKAIMLNSPSNPTGMVYSSLHLEAIADICVEHGIYIIADEIYDKLVYSGKTFTSMASLSPEIKDITILVNGVSKSYAMTGWRIGWACANAEIAKVMANYQSHSASSPSSVSQAAAAEALNGPQEEIAYMRGEFEKRRDYFYDRASVIDGVSCIKPDGAFYIFMDVSQQIGRMMFGKKIESAAGFASLLLEKEGVAVVPCEDFGADNYIRWSYATSMELIREGLDRFERFLKG